MKDAWLASTETGSRAAGTEILLTPLADYEIGCEGTRRRMPAPRRAAAMVLDFDPGTQAHAAPNAFVC
jgi:hypothetical protein